LHSNLTQEGANLPKKFSHYNLQLALSIFARQGGIKLPQIAKTTSDNMGKVGKTSKKNKKYKDIFRYIISSVVLS